MNAFLQRIVSVGLVVAAALAGFAGAASPGPAVPPAGETAKVRIAFHAENAVHGENYALGDIATVTCSDPAERRRIESLAVGRSPYLGATLPLSARFLTLHLDRQGIGGEQAALDFPERMTVRRASQEVAAADLRDAIEDQLRRRLGPAARDVIIEDIQLPSSVPLPEGQLTVRAEFRLPTRNLGLAAFNADLLVDGVARRRVAGTLRLDRKIEALQLVSGVPRGETIGGSVCKPTPARLSALRGNPLLARDLETNPTAKRDLPAGSVLTWSEVEKRQLVRRGQMVRMVLESAGGMRITTRGQARGNGAYGDLVEVVNVSSGKRIQGIVAGEQLVRVPF